MLNIWRLELKINKYKTEKKAVRCRDAVILLEVPLRWLIWCHDSVTMVIQSFTLLHSFIQLFTNIYETNACERCGTDSLTASL